MTDPQLEAFRRLLLHASSGEQAKLDAVVALSQRTVLAATWDSQGQRLRTLLNSQRANALPIFTDPSMLQAAARRFGWQLPDGTTPAKEIGAREAFRYAIVNDVAYVVVDITAPHAMEVDQQEMQPFFSSKTHREASGPFAAVGLDSSAYKAVKEPPKKHESAPPPVMTVDDILDEVATVLRSYPEVEWGFLYRRPDEEHSLVAIRIDPTFPTRTSEILEAVRTMIGGAQLVPLSVDSPELVREVRTQGMPFYPWRK